VFVLAVGAALVLCVQWFRADTGNAHEAVAKACRDADHLYAAHLLQESSEALVRIKRSDGHAYCDTASMLGIIRRDQRAAAHSLEQARTYLLAASLKRVAKGASDRERARRRARWAYVAALRLDPFDTAARTELQKLLRDLRPPRDTTAANRHCRIADGLRDAGLLPEARLVYAQALRTGRNTHCLKSGLGELRAAAGNAHGALARARAEAATEQDAQARNDYITALDVDPSLPSARSELAALPAPDARDANNGGRWTNAAEAGIGDLDDAVDWADGHIAGIVLGGILLLLAVVLLMGALLLVSWIKPLRRAMDWVPPFRRFTRARTHVAAFTPEDKGWSSGSVFAHYFPRPAIGKKRRLRKVQSVSLDVFEAAADAGDPAAGAVGVLQAVPQAAALTAAATWLRDIAPRREVKVNGQLLYAGANRYGLRILVTGRRGRSADSKAFWAADLPGPGFDKDDEDAARHALAIVGAAWAHERANR
jgi:hypothetical protein